MADLTSKIGTPGCTGGSEGKPARADGPFTNVGSGTLHGASKSKTFRVVCDFGVFAIHPDDTGWVLRAVEGYMPVKPVWMKGGRKFFRGGKWITIPAGFTFQPTLWSCPDCLPKSVWKNDEIAGYDNAKCEPGCNAGGLPDTDAYHSSRTERFGYDNRVMHPWTTAEDSYDSDACVVQPGNANTICLPRLALQGNDSAGDFCRALALGGYDVKYRKFLWASAGIGIRNYNAHVLAGAKDAPPTSTQASKSPTPNYVPAAVAAVLTGVGALLIWRRR